VSYIQLPEGEKIRALDLLPTDGSEIAIALNSGNVWILAVNDFINPRGKKGSVFVDPSLNAYHILIDQAARVRSLDSSLQVPGPKTVIHSTSEEFPIVISEICVLPQKARQWAQEIKFSFEGSFLAVASHDRAIYVYERIEESVVAGGGGGGGGAGEDKSSGHKEEKSGGKGDNSSGSGEGSKTRIVYKFLVKMPSGEAEGHATYITHIDFGVMVTHGEKGEYDPSTKKFYEYSGDNRVEAVGRHLNPKKDLCLQSSCAAYELLFWRMDGTRIDSPSAMKDTWWATWTTPIGMYYVPCPRRMALKAVSI
jgi:hypothetical protein